MNRETRQALDYTTGDLFDEFVDAVGVFEVGVVRPADPIEIGVILMLELRQYGQKIINVNPDTLGTEFLDVWTDARIPR